MRKEWEEEAEDILLPTDEGTSLNLSLVITSIGVNIQCRSLIFEGREGSLVKHTKWKGRG